MYVCIPYSLREQFRCTHTANKWKGRKKNILFCMLARLYIHVVIPQADKGEIESQINYGINTSTSARDVYILLAIAILASFFVGGPSSAEQIHFRPRLSSSRGRPRG